MTDSIVLRLLRASVFADDESAALFGEAALVIQELMSALVIVSHWDGDHEGSGGFAREALVSRNPKKMH